MFDYDKTTPLNILEYETLSELIGKYLKVKLALKRATDIPEKYSFKTMAKYEWIDSERTLFETQVREKTRDPDFAYVMEHTEQITDEFLTYLTHNTLTVKILGMIESKKKKQRGTKSEAFQSDYQSDANQTEAEQDKTDA